MDALDDFNGQSHDNRNGANEELKKFLVAMNEIKESFREHLARLQKEEHAIVVDSLADHITWYCADMERRRPGVYEKMDAHFGSVQERADKLAALGASSEQVAPWRATLESDRDACRNVITGIDGFRTSIEKSPEVTPKYAVARERLLESFDVSIADAAAWRDRYQKAIDTLASD